VTIDVPYTVTTGTTTTKETASTQTTTQSSTETHELSVEAGVEFSQEFEEEVTVGEPDDEVKTGVNIGFKESLTTGTTNTWANTTAGSNEYSKVKTDEATKQVEIGPAGCLQASLLFTSTSVVPFTLSADTQVQAVVPDPDMPGEVQVLANLQIIGGSAQPDQKCPATQNTSGISLSQPGDSARVAMAAIVNSQTLLAYMVNPAPITSLGGVANAVKPDGSPDPNNGLWTVTGDAQGIADKNVAFPDITLQAANSMLLTYMADGDNDGLPNHQEIISGTTLDDPDTDGDGLGDKFETQKGWTVPLPRGGQPSYQTYSSPLSCDADGDGSPDGGGNAKYGTCPPNPAESARVPNDATHGTDPKDPDTNEDGVFDGAQPYPNVLQLLPPGGRMPVFALQWGGAGKGNGTFNRPGPIAVNRDPNDTSAPPEVYVADTGNGSDPEVRLGPDRRHGSVQGQLPRGPATGPAQGARRLAGQAPAKNRTDKPGNLLYLSGVHGQFLVSDTNERGTETLPPVRFLGVDHMNGGHLDFDASGNLFVANANNSTADPPRDRAAANNKARPPYEAGRFPSTSVVASIGRKSPDTSDSYDPSQTPDQLINPAGITLDAGGEIYIAEGMADWKQGLKKFSENKVLQATHLWDNLTHPPTVPWQPGGVAADPKG
jgi:hypothetical protein